MSVPDIVFTVIGVFFVFRGILRGFIAEFMSMAALVCGIAVGFIFHGTLSPHIKEHIANDTWRPVVAFLLLFIATYIVVKIIEICLHRIITTIQLNGLDRCLGVAWGIVEGAAVITLIVFVIYAFKFDAGIKFLKNSVAADYAREFLKSINVETFKDIPVIGNFHV